MSKKQPVAKNNDSAMGAPSMAPATVNAESNPQRVIDMRELGGTGLKRFGGFLYEDFLPELNGQSAVRVYKEMSENDATIAAVLFAIEMLIRRVKWFSVAPSDKKEDQEAAEFLETCMNDMSHTWIDLIAEILSMLRYGYDVQEIVYKQRCGDNSDPSKRSKYNDGRIGWRKMPTRSQDSVYRWDFDDHGGIRGVEQMAPPKYLRVTIPIEKMLLFRTTISKNNPEGRPLTLDTLIPTPEGWTTIGDIEVGDSVFDEKGAIRKVTGKSEVFENRPIYEIEFSTGHTVKADSCHQWSVTTANDRHHEKTPRLMTTEDIFCEVDRKPGKHHLSCGLAPVIKGSKQDLLLDPYLLGYWLGNGATTKAEVSCHQDDAPFISSQYAQEYQTKIHHPKNSLGANIFIRDGLLDDLRTIDVLGDKHIPAEYLRASIDQRLALLQGLMDSDGNSPATGKDTASCFHNVDLNLINGTAELVRSLGGRPHVRVRQKAGRKGGQGIVSKRDLYEVRFHLDMPIHRLQRKAVNQNIELNSRTAEHFIKTVRRVDNEDTQCIEVDSPSHLFLCGEGMVPTHNSMLRGCYRSWYVKKNIENIEAIGIERDLAGLPVAYVPPEMLSPNASVEAKATLAAIKNVVVNVRRNAEEGMVLPIQYDPIHGKPIFDFKLLSTGGARQFDTTAIINRWDQRIAMTALADFILLGQDKVGSFALASSKTNLFSTAIGAILDIIADVFNRYAIPRLFAVNDFKITDYPTLKHGDLGSVDLNELGNYITKLSQAGMPLFPNEDLEKHLLDIAGMPPPPAEDQGPGSIPVEMPAGIDANTKVIPDNRAGPDSTAMSATNNIENETDATRALEAPPIQPRKPDYV